MNESIIIKGKKTVKQFLLENKKNYKREKSTSK